MQKEAPDEFSATATAVRAVRVKDVKRLLASGCELTRHCSLTNKSTHSSKEEADIYLNHTEKASSTTYYI